MISSLVKYMYVIFERYPGISEYNPLENNNKYNICNIFLFKREQRLRLQEAVVVSDSLDQGVYSTLDRVLLE